MLFYSFSCHFAILRRNINPDIISLEVYRRNCRCPGTHEWVQNDFCVRGGNNSVNQVHRKGGRMFVVHFLRKFPNITVSICFCRKFEFWLGDKVNYFVGWQEISSIKIEAAFPSPNDNLSHRKSTHYVLTILQ